MNEYLTFLGFTFVGTVIGFCVHYFVMKTGLPKTALFGMALGGGAIGTMAGMLALTHYFQPTPWQVAVMAVMASGGAVLFPITVSNWMPRD